MEKYYVLEGSSPVEVLHTGSVSRQGHLIKVRRRNDIVEITRDELITVREYDGNPGTARVILSTDDDLNGFFFSVKLSTVHHMTLEEQSEYIALKARRELIKLFLQSGLKNLIKLNAQLKTLHLHTRLDSEKDYYACDHKHTHSIENPSTAEMILNALTQYPENPRDSLERLRRFLRNQTNADKQKALETFLEAETEDVKERVRQAEITEDGRDEYLLKFSIVQYLKYAQTLPVQHDIVNPTVLSDLWMLEWQYRNVRIALLPKHN
jgi:hypothetical protein